MQRTDPGIQEPATDAGWGGVHNALPPYADGRQLQRRLAKGNLEVAVWLKSVMGNKSCCLRTTMDIMLTTLMENSTGNLIVASPTRMMLPSGLNSTDRTAVQG